MSEISEICGNCTHVDSKHGTDCICSLNNDFEKVHYFDDGCDCYLNRSENMNNERLVNFD